MATERTESHVGFLLKRARLAQDELSKRQVQEMPVVENPVSETKGYRELTPPPDGQWLYQTAESKNPIKNPPYEGGIIQGIQDRVSSFLSTREKNGDRKFKWAVFLNTNPEMKMPLGETQEINIGGINFTPQNLTPEGRRKQ